MQIKFNTLEQAQKYIWDLSYRLNKNKNKFVFKGEKAFIYKHRTKRKYIYLSPSLEYLNTDTIDRGTIWKLEAF